MKKLHVHVAYFNKVSLFAFVIEKVLYSVFLYFMQIALVTSLVLIDM